jgi:hypothetical protein
MSSGSSGSSGANLPAAPAIVTEGLHKSFGKTAALSGVDLQVRMFLVAAGKSASSVNGLS